MSIIKARDVNTGLRMTIKVQSSDYMREIRKKILFKNSM